MPRQNRAVAMEGHVPKIRKRGCSTPSSSSSRVHNYRSKRAILVGKARAGHGLSLAGSRSTTPVPTWRTTPLRAAVESPRLSQSGHSRPVSARRLAATLWEMNAVPSPRVGENLERKKKGLMPKMEKMGSGHSVSGSFPPHLCDPYHSPVSESTDRSGMVSLQRRLSSISRRLLNDDHAVAVLDSFSSASLMEIETRSRAKTPSGSVVGGKNRMKDVSNALTTAKELLKIINRKWALADQQSSSLSIVSALHAELERARLQVNQLILEQRPEETDINYIRKCFAEEKAMWKKKEQQAVESAIESIVGELEVERKLRRRLESVNKKLGNELAETKASFLKVVKELESVKIARELSEQDASEDKTEIEELKREPIKILEDIKKEREIIKLADRLHEGRVQMKLSGTKHQFEEKSRAVDKLRKQLEAFLVKGKGNEKRSKYHQNEEDDGEVEDAMNGEEDSAESDLHSIELNTANGTRNDKWAYSSSINLERARASVDNDRKERSSISRQIPRRSTSILRSISDGTEWGAQEGGVYGSTYGFEAERLQELEKQAQGKGYLNEPHRHKSVKSLYKDHVSSDSRIGSVRNFRSPQIEQAPRESMYTVRERSNVTQGTSSKSRLAEAVGHGQIHRRSMQ